MNLASVAARGALITLVGQGGRIALQLLGVIVLARLLGPQDFGLIAMSTVFIGVAELLRDFGLSNAAIQAKTLTNHQRDTLFWLNTALGALLCCALYFGAPLIAALYDHEQLVSILQWLSLVLLFGGIGTQYRASLTRRMQFGRLVSADLLSQALGLSLGVGTALAGWGPYALVAQQLGIAALELILVAIAGRWIPRLPRRNINIWPFVKYGINLLITQMLIYVSKNSDKVVLGLRFSASTVGIYDRAYQLLMVPLMQLNSPFTRVALPTLSKLQDDPEIFARYLLRAQKLLMYLAVSIVAFIASQALPIVNILLGERWEDSAKILQILAVGGLFYVVYYTTMWIFLSKALTKEYLYFTLLTRPIMIALICSGSIWGAEGVAYGYSLFLILQWPFALWWVRDVPGVYGRAIFLNGLRIILLLIAATAPGFAVSTMWRPLPDILNLGIGAACMGILMAIAVVVVPSFRSDYRDLKDALKRALQR